LTDAEQDREFRELLSRHGALVDGLMVQWDERDVNVGGSTTPASLAFLRRIDAALRPADPPQQVRQKPILALDFDGVIHSYASGWKGADNIPDPPVPGAIEWIIAQGLTHFTIAIYSARSKSLEGRTAMWEWLYYHMKVVVQAVMQREAGGETVEPERVEATVQEFLSAIQFPEHKPAAFLTIDDRALRFTGIFPSAAELLATKTWQGK
jgi:hypothetical protein